MSKTIWFDTGVRPGFGTPPTKPYGCQVVRGGTIQIPMEVEDVPEGAIFEHAISVLRDIDRMPYRAVREILNAGQPGAIVSKYAVFLILPKEAE